MPRSVVDPRVYMLTFEVEAERRFGEPAISPRDMAHLLQRYLPVGMVLASTKLTASCVIAADVRLGRIADHMAPVRDDSAPLGAIGRKGSENTPQP